MPIRQLFAGARAAFPITLGYLPVGIAFGVLARQAGLGWPEAAAMSFFVYAGASQFIAVDMLMNGADIFSIIATTFLINLRHVLMGSALSRHFKRHNLPMVLVLGAQMTDESFGLSMAAPARIDNRPWYLFGLQATAHLAWVGGSLAGVLFGAFISSDAYGIPFALPALFICLLVLQIKGKTSLVVIAVAGVLAVLLKRLLPGNWYLILSALGAAGVGVLLSPEKEIPEEYAAGTGPG